MAHGKVNQSILQYNIADSRTIPTGVDQNFLNQTIKAC